MTKKLLSLLVAFALLAMPCLTLAEEYQTYVSEDKSVTFLYPSDWILLSRENIDTMIDAAATVEEVAELEDTVEELPEEPAKAEEPAAEPVKAEEKPEEAPLVYALVTKDGVERY